MISYLSGVLSSKSGNCVRLRNVTTRDRVHRGLDRAPPDEKGGITDRTFTRLDDYRWEKFCRDLFQLPAAA